MSKVLGAKTRLAWLLPILFFLGVALLAFGHLRRLNDESVRSMLARPKLGDVFVNQSGMRMVWVPPGVLRDFGPIKGSHRVAVRGFWMSSSLVSRRSFLEFVGNVNATVKGPVFYSANCVSFGKAHSYCVALNEREKWFGDKYGLSMKYRLPTEFELAYAYRQNNDDLCFDVATNLEEITYFRGVYCEWTSFDPRWSYERSGMKCIRGRIGKPVLAWYTEDFEVRMTRDIHTEDNENPSVGFRVVLADTVVTR